MPKYRIFSAGTLLKVFNSVTNTEPVRLCSLSMHTVIRTSLFVIAVAIFVLLPSVPLKAQFSLAPIAYPTGLALDVAGFPTLKAQVRATYKGQPVVLGANTTFIVETNVAIPAASVTHTGNGVHIIEWTALRFDAVNVRIMSSYEGETSVVTLTSALDRLKGATVVVRDSTSRNLPRFVDFGRVPAGHSDTMKLKIVATEAAVDTRNPPQERQIRIESITTTNPAFTVLWKGSFSSGPLPTNVISPLEYRVDLVFEPINTDPISDVLTVTYEGGMKTTVMIVANPPSYPRRSILNLISPNGGERFAPCQVIPIRWTGMVPGFKAHLEYSSDNGKTWSAIDSTMDSTLLWRVPEEFTEQARIRVYQKFEATGSQWLQGPAESCIATAYNANGRYLLSAYQNGEIVEWDVSTGLQTGSYLIPNAQSAPPSALAYVGSSRSFVVVQTSSGSGGGTIHLLNSGTAAPVASQTLPPDIQVRGVATNLSGNTAFILPRFGARIPRYNIPDLTSAQPIILGSTAATTSVNGSRLVVALANGEIVQYSTETGAELARSQTHIPESLGPYAHVVASSLDGRLVALGCARYDGSLNAPKEQRTFIHDMTMNRIVKILHREGSNPVNLTFSPSGAYLGLGYEFNPQFVVYDMLTGKVLPPTGSAAGHSNRLTSITFSPDGSTVITSSTDKRDNLLLRRVSVPEADTSDAVFAIRPIGITATTITLNPQYIGTSADTVVTSHACNTGDVLAVFESARLTHGTWLRFATPIQNDTVAPGECLKLHLATMVRDTGLLVDTVEATSCGTTIRIPIQVYVTDRNLALLIQAEDFGDLCVGSKRLRRLAVLRNNDPISVTINAVYVEGGLNAQFRIAEIITNRTLDPGATLEVSVEFIPKRYGLDTGVVTVQYAGQDAVTRKIIVLGRGSGADLQVSHPTLPFIPEITEREVTIRNNSDNAVTIDSATVTAGEPFVILTPLPLSIQPRDSVTMRIAYVGGPIGNQASVSLHLQPCPSQTTIALTAYAGEATLSVPGLTSDPRNDTLSIPIVASVTEAVAYNGMRFLEGVVRIHPRLYLAKEIVSTLGKAEILSQSIVQDVREIRFRVEGSFTGIQEVARLIGYAGMAETDETDIVFDTAASGFGSSVAMNYRSGHLRIVHPDPNRRIIRTPSTIQSLVVSPNPATEQVVLQLQATQSGEARVEFVDQSGTVVLGTMLVVIPTNQPIHIPFSVRDLPTGVYSVLVSFDSQVFRVPLVVVR